MDSSSVQVTSAYEDDDWDNDSFVIPSLGIENADSIVASDSKPDSKPPPKDKKEDSNIYLGPHGAPPCREKQQENPWGRKQQFKQKLKEADKRIGGTGHENKVENIRQLVGGRNTAAVVSKGSNRDWLDPHCHESEFEKCYR